jgi:hypothetical protein
MTNAFLLQHVHLLSGGEEDVKTLGVYSSRSAAMAAVERFRTLPGFRDVPGFAHTSAPGPTQGFYLDEYEIDKDNWAEGFEIL